MSEITPMVERVAREIFRNGWGERVWDVASDEQHSIAYIQARAAIEAMRDYHPVVRQPDYEGGPPEVVHILQGRPDDIWKALLAAALGEKS